MTRQAEYFRAWKQTPSGMASMEKERAKRRQKYRDNVDGFRDKCAARYREGREKMAARSRERYWENRAEILAKHKEYRGRPGVADRTRRHILKRLYGITVEQYDAMFAEQGGVCAICSRPPGKKRLFVDHCHKTGKVRALLCQGCNAGIGHFADDVGRLLAAVEYLRRHSGQEAL